MMSIVLLAAALAGGVMAQDSSRITAAEWIAFRGDRGVLNALRIVNQAGVEGFWVGDAKGGPVQPLLDKLQGLDVTDPEAAWDELGNRKLPNQLRNALDVAIWDLHGRVKGQPVGKLLGPAKREKVQFYLSGFPDMTAEQNVRAVKDAAERRIRGYRIYAYLDGRGVVRNAATAPQWLAADLALARAVKAASPADLPLMFYPGASYNLEQALQVGAVLDELKYGLFVDPLPMNAVADYQTLRQRLATPLCATVGAKSVAEGAVDMAEIDLYAGFTPCLRFVRACAQAGVPLDLHGGFPMDLYQFPLYGFAGDDVLPWIGWHGRSPKWIPVATEFRGSEVRPKNFPWLKWVQTRPLDAAGFVHIVYEIPGMGVEPDWDWIKQHEAK